MEQGDAVLWIQVHEPTAEELQRLHALLALTPDILEHLRTEEHRVKLVRYGDLFHVTLRDMQLQGSQLEMCSIDVVLGNRWMLTQHGGDYPGMISFASVERQIVSERVVGNVHDIGTLVWALMDQIVDRYFKVSDQLDDRIDSIEETVFGVDAHPGVPEESYALRRSIVKFRRSSAPLREVLIAILRHEVTVIGNDTVPLFQDVTDHILRIADLIESQREVLTGLIEAHLAIVSNNMNRVMKATSSWGAILLVSTLIAGIYGMNFRHMPELSWTLGYPIAIGSMVLLTFVLYRTFKSRDWL